MAAERRRRRRRERGPESSPVEPSPALPEEKLATCGTVPSGRSRCIR